PEKIHIKFRSWFCCGRFTGSPTTTDRGISISLSLDFRYNNNRVGALASTYDGRYPPLCAGQMKPPSQPPSIQNISGVAQGPAVRSVIPWMGGKPTVQPWPSLAQSGGSRPPCPT